MSVKQMALVWEHEFPHNKQSIMLALTDHANDQGQNIFPSVARIAWKTGYSKRQVSRIIRSLTEDKVLVKVRFSSQHRPNEYRVNWKKTKRKAEFITKARADKMSTLKKSESTSGNTRVDVSSSRVDTAESTKPSLEPSFNKPLNSSLKNKPQCICGAISCNCEDITPEMVSEF